MTRCTAARGRAGSTGAVRNGETAFVGFGEIADGSGKEPARDTMFRIGSVSKVFCGGVLSRRLRLPPLVVAVSGMVPLLPGLA